MCAVIIDQIPSERLGQARVLLRADNDYPHQCLETVKHLLDSGASVIVTSDFTSSAGDRFAQDCSDLFGRPVRCVTSASRSDVFRTVQLSSNRELILLDLASSPEDRQNDPRFARFLASLADIYCNDAFSIAHLALASTVGIARFAPELTAGFALARHMARLETALHAGVHPSLAIVGGIDFERKAFLLCSLCNKVDQIFVGGTVCFPFFRAAGLDAGVARFAKDIVSGRYGHAKIILPDDFVTVSRTSETHIITGATEVLPSQVRMDIGPETVHRLEVLVRQARVLLWNGPLGVWEIDSYGRGTRVVADAVAVGAAAGLRGVIWGGSLRGLLEEIDNTGGPLTEMIEPAPPTRRFVSGLPLPALEALSRNQTPSRRRVVLPVDESSESIEFVTRAGPLLACTRSEIHLLAITSRSPQEADRVFSRFESLLGRFGMTPRASRIIRIEPEVKGLLDYAREIDADVIAVPCRSKSTLPFGISRDWKQSLRKRATIPVLLVTTDQR